MSGFLQRLVDRSLGGAGTGGEAGTAVSLAPRRPSRFEPEGGAAIGLGAGLTATGEREEHPGRGGLTPKGGRVGSSSGKERRTRGEASAWPVGEAPPAASGGPEVVPKKDPGFASEFFSDRPSTSPTPLANVLTSEHLEDQGSELTRGDPTSPASWTPAIFTASAAANQAPRGRPPRPLFDSVSAAAVLEPSNTDFHFPEEPAHTRDSAARGSMALEPRAPLPGTASVRAKSAAAPRARTSRRGEASETVVQVTIGRIEVRSAHEEKPKARKARRPAAPRLSLDDYQRRRREGA